MQEGEQAGGAHQAHHPGRAHQARGAHQAHHAHTQL